MKRRIILISAAVVALIFFTWWFTQGADTEKIQLTTEVVKGPFKSLVTSTGELRAKQSTSITGPREVRNYRISEMKIADLIPEGTVVDSGAYVGRLDPSQIANVEKDLLNELDKTTSQYTQTKLDTALELRAKRDEIKNLKFGVEERKIEVKYSEFEPPAIQRQAQINLEKAERAYTNSLESYQLKKRQSVAKVQEVGAQLAIQQNSLKKLRDIMKEFTIFAPQDGMVIYAREWGGQKKTVGSTISSWNPTLAELPDMSTMISQTMVNEVDISKVKVGQEVLVGIDAFPDKTYEGKVTYVANMGENNKGASGKTFEVTVQLNKPDTILRPGMTTSNDITIFTEEDVVSVPLAAVNIEDSISYVVVKDGLGFKKQEVELGRGNDLAVIIKQGVKEGDEVYLMLPEGVEAKPIERLKPEA